ncbi:MAG: mechanosensitive ion channel domain-containing protein [Pseudomonadota bacterium]
MRRPTLSLRPVTPALISALTLVILCTAMLFNSGGVRDAAAQGVDDAATETAPATQPDARIHPPRGIATGAGGINRLPSATPAGDGASGNADSAADPLVEVLSDRAARDRLIRALEAMNEQQGEMALQVEAEAAEADDARPPGDEISETAEAGADASANASADAGPRRLSLGRRIAETTAEAASDFADGTARFFAGLSATQRRLAGFARVEMEDVAAIGRDIAVTFLTTFAVFLVLRIIARPIWRRLGTGAAGGSFLRQVWVFLLSVALDAATVLMALASGYSIALFLRGTAGDISIHEALFLNAFVVVEMIKVLVRTGIAPSEGRLRPLPLSDGAARYWARWSNVLLSILGYGQLMIVPLVNEVVNLFTGRAAAVVIFVAVLITTAILVVLNRKAPTVWLEKQAKAQDGDMTLGLMAQAARYLWIAILAYLALLFVFAVSQSGHVMPVLSDTLRILGVALVGGLTASALSRAAARGVKVPGAVSESLPMLERRLNTFVPLFLKIIRFVILVTVIAFATSIVGLFDLRAWLDGELGGDATATLISVFIMLLTAFAIWLAMTSWVDFRLTPRWDRSPTAREQTLLTLLKNAGTIAIVVITLMFSLSEIGIDIAPLIASAGVLGLAIGFGAQKMVQDIITGIFIQFENAINVGDVITVGGTTGTVEKLTIRSVSLRDLHGVFHVIPFSSVDMVSNYMRSFAYHVADLGIAYREDIDAGRAVMQRCFDAMRADPEWRHKISGDLEWFGVQELGDSAVVLRARVRTTPGTQWGVGRQYNELLKKACDAEGIEIPFPHMTIWMGEGKDGLAPPMHLRSEGGTAPRPPAAPAADPAIGKREAHSRLVAPVDDMPDSDD